MWFIEIEFTVLVSKTKRFLLCMPVQSISTLSHFWFNFVELNFIFNALLNHFRSFCIKSYQNLHPTLQKFCPFLHFLSNLNKFYTILHSNFCAHSILENVPFWFNYGHKLNLQCISYRFLLCMPLQSISLFSISCPVSCAFR